MRCMNHTTTYSIYRGVRVGACEECRAVRFGDGGDGSGAWDAMSHMFGNFELVGRVDTIRAPATEVLAYRAPRPADGAALRVTPPHRWFKVNKHLWMCHDGTLLLLAHGLPCVSRRVVA